MVVLSSFAKSNSSIVEKHPPPLLHAYPDGIRLPKNLVNCDCGGAHNGTIERVHGYGAHEGTDQMARASRRAGVQAARPAL
eukprot:79374-Rhodomonas_salina.2